MVVAVLRLDQLRQIEKHPLPDAFLCHSDPVTGR
nr:MAG TPA: hypothetical protein [Caudoviricetes sp.]DAQ34781.1 MAG TPA: hypothetical protein [Caudoviricetes sp.]DAQ86819.1 MAG TPA: hypothetical protein [Caudoviricetes sp.]